MNHTRLISKQIFTKDDMGILPVILSITMIFEFEWIEVDLDSK